VAPLLRQISLRDKWICSGRLMMMISSSSVFVNVFTARGVFTPRRAEEAPRASAAAAGVGQSVERYTSSAWRSEGLVAGVSRVVEREVLPTASAAPRVRFAYARG